MDTPQLPKWYSVERRNEVLQKFKAYVLTREGAVVTAIVAVAIIALATGMFYVVKNRNQNSREALEKVRLEEERQLNAQAVRLTEEETNQRLDAQAQRLQEGETGIPDAATVEREKEQLNRLGN